MAHTLTYIGQNNNTYTTTEGGSTAETQDLNLNDLIQPGVLAGRSVVEQTSLKLYDISTHPYYKINDGTRVVDSVSAANIPNYLIGWKTASNNIVSVGQILTQEFVNNNFQGQTNLNLYGIWNSTRLIRVIVFIDKDDQSLKDLKYNVSVSAENSYNSSTNYYLTDNYKEISDYGNNLEFTNGTWNVREYGYGYGCPLNGVIRYFGAKDGDSISVSITPDINYANEYVPYFNVVGNTITYKCFPIDDLCREDVSPQQTYSAYGEEIVYNSSTNTWTAGGISSNLTEIDIDKTVFFPLVPKPVVTVVSSPLGAGTLSGGGAYMPGATCTVSATPDANYTFVEWKRNNTSFNPPETSTSYSFPVTESVLMTAVFASVEPNVYLSWLTNDSGMITAGFVSYMVGVYTVSMDTTFATPKALTYEQGTTIRIRASRVANNGYVFMGWYTYSGSTRNPLVDTLLTEDNDSTTTMSYYTFTVGVSTSRYYAYYSKA